MNAIGTEKSRIDIFRIVVESAPYATIVTDRNGNIVLVNILAEKYFGHSRDELLGKSIEVIIPERFREQFVNDRLEFLENPISQPMGVGLELYGLRKDGTEFPVEIGLNPIETDGNLMVLVAVIDNSERMRSKEKFRLAVEAAPSGIIMVDNQGRITLVNSQVQCYFGYSGDELIGQPIETLLSTAFQDNHPTLRHGFMQKPESRPMGTGRDLYAIRKDGSEFPVEVGLNPIETENGIEVLAVVVDITQRKRMEEEQRFLEVQIQQTQKLESLGVLAGGIAHDFNNLLTGILGNADLAMLELSAVSSARGCIEDIQKASLRAADLCKQMLAYSGKGKFLIQPLDLNQIIQEMTHLLRISISKTAVINYNLYPQLPAVEADATQIRQVVMNLITNASEAIGDKSGVITITTGVMECDAQYLSETILHDNPPPGIYVYFEVADTGCGMDAQTQDKIFDPFYTTKFSGRGLGLAAVLGIVRSHKGAIKVYSEKGQGSTFKILFPCSDKKAIKFSDEALALDQLRGEGTVLVIDDEDTVRAVARRSLEIAGFRVLTAPDGLEGLKVFEENQKEISLVLLDLTMPHLNGDEVFRKIRRIRPGTPIIITSGYNEQELSSRFPGKGVTDFVQKPIRPRILLTKVKSALSRK